MLLILTPKTFSDEGYNVLYFIVRVFEKCYIKTLLGSRKTIKISDSKLNTLYDTLHIQIVCDNPDKTSKNLHNRFKEDLLKESRIKVKNVPYYLRWILECYGYLKRSLEEKVHDEEKDESLRTLSATHEQWPLPKGVTLKLGC